MRLARPLAISALTTAALIATALPSRAQPAPAPAPTPTPAPTSAPTPAPSARTVVTSQDQLPRRTLKLAQLPSQLLGAPRAELLALAQQLETNVRGDLAAFDIKDAATMRSYLGTLLTLAQFKGDWAAVPGLVQQLKALQDKPGPRATTGVLAQILADQQAGQKDAAWVRAEVEKRYGALPWADAGDLIKSSKGQFELLNPALVRGAFEQQVDVAARNMNLTVPEGMVASILGARLQQDLVVPLKDALVGGLQAVVDRHTAQAPAKPDLWTPRQFAIPATARATPVGVGIWDSGVDLTLFQTTANPGLAMNDDGRLNRSDLLRPLGDAAPRWPALRQLVKGSMDLRAALDTEDARRLKQTVSTLKPEQVKAFQEDLSLAGVYTHGTHVAGIAVAGNPFARVHAATLLYNVRSEPTLPTEERSRRWGEAFRAMVEGFKAQQLRVVNMSWRYGAASIEGALTWHNVGASPEARKQMARTLFAIERDALRDAIAGAPDILFVAGSGNEDNSADFAEYIPAGLELPNLITVGAVDQAGEETSFSTFGKTVVVHANGFEVESLLPGGDRMKFSGTSMASPQVANLAAKLFALRPELTVAQVKDAILRGAEPRGKVKLLNPRRSAALLGIEP